jgi:hypothetical protein
VAAWLKVGGLLRASAAGGLVFPRQSPGASPEIRRQTGRGPVWPAHRQSPARPHGQGVQRTTREAYEIGEDVRLWVKRREASRQLLDGAPLLTTGQTAFALHSSKGVARSGYHNLDGARATD